MTDRRKFLQSAAALTAAPWAHRTAFAGMPRPAATTFADTTFVYDSRHIQAQVFAHQAQAVGAAVREIGGDITTLWLRELRIRWASARPGVVVGLTERPALFLLERLGWDHGLRVVFQAEHEIADAGGHQLLQGGNRALASHLAHAGSHWPAVLADALLHESFATNGKVYPADAALAHSLHEAPMLYSWAIAPRSPLHS